jgi:hypothetical protein
MGIRSELYRKIELHRRAEDRVKKLENLSATMADALQEVITSSGDDLSIEIAVRALAEFRSSVDVSNAH